MNEKEGRMLCTCTFGVETHLKNMRLLFFTNFWVVYQQYLVYTSQEFRTHHVSGFLINQDKNLFAIFDMMRLKIGTTK